MARSKVSTPSGKKVTPKKKRDTKRKASVHIESVKPGSKRSKVIRINDGDGTIYRNGQAITNERESAKYPNAIRHKTTDRKERSVSTNVARSKKKHPPNKK
tara:strand:+ start:158 stop:460 length:303 start_codon:yes stop_codon:yes gene_type:complete